MALIAPSILSADFANLGADVREVIEKGADWIHVDVMDGRFVPNITIGPPVVKSLKPIVGNVPLDCHLMIVEPDKYIQEFRDAGADYITVHAEACTHLHRSIQAIHASGAKAGVALNPHTPPAALEYVLDMLDLVLVMTVNPGFGGQSLIDNCLCKISAIREQIDRRGLSTVIEVDGGVKVSNAKRFTDAGADVLVSGSGIFKAEDRGAAIAALRNA
jgi:ribulose-phosphate 3-epimerase